LTGKTWEVIQLFYEKLIFNLLSFYANNTHSPENFCFDSMYFKKSDSSHRKLLSDNAMV